MITTLSTHQTCRNYYKYPLCMLLTKEKSKHLDDTTLINNNTSNSLIDCFYHLKPKVNYPTLDSCYFKWVNTKLSVNYIITCFFLCTNKTCFEYFNCNSSISGTVLYHPHTSKAYNNTGDTIMLLNISS